MHSLGCNCSPHGLRLSVLSVSAEVVIGGKFGACSPTGITTFNHDSLHSIPLLDRIKTKLPGPTFTPSSMYLQRACQMTVLNPKPLNPKP